MGKRGFIFDLDGVIVDTAKYHYLAWKNLANELGFDFTEEQNEAFKGVSRRRCLEILLELGGITVDEAQFEQWLHEKNEDYLSYIARMDASEILPDVPRVLNFLKENHVPMALGSASKNAIPILEKVDLLSYFDTVVDGNKVTRAKPDPEVFLIAARDIQVSPENCVVFEDAVAGIEAANSADMISVGIGDPGVLSEAQHVFKDFTEIDIKFIKQLVHI
ncbi:beta-phosphoglucomutase [Lentiprolixibacter aurantiacus]|uniref:Beta-phosphoglucomutase n=1 Tax=Lentiprolixibacter aurantiacus TaxID=2993939 RepID=A0AAE3MIQ7_9FLAO|nr:beta-phosphoglucomutase [Lentiprolixibacter aurantiacus]MCX2718168.1 beta-phosphoglucomutase [Lentiprolixibacter aurantiacus]